MPQNSELSVAFSSLSVTPTSLLRPDLLLPPRRNAEATVQRAVALRNRLIEGFSANDVSVSVLPGRNVDLLELYDELWSGHTTVSSIDVPDVESLFENFLRAGRDVFRRPQGLVNDLGWAFSNVGSVAQMVSNTEKALNIFGSTGNEQLVKANASFWRTGNERQGDALDAFLRRYQEERRPDGINIGLAIEIDPKHQTHDEYLRFLEKKREEHSNGLAIYADIDIAHMERAHDIFTDKDVPHALTTLETMLFDASLSNTIKLISLNQYVQGDTASHHARFDRGTLDLEEVMRLMGKAALKDVRPTLLLETNPRDYDWYLDDASGGVFYQQFRKAYDQGAGIYR